MDSLDQIEALLQSEEDKDGWYAAKYTHTLGEMEPTLELYPVNNNCRHALWARTPEDAVIAAQAPAWGTSLVKVGRALEAQGHRDWGDWHLTGCPFGNGNGPCLARCIEGRRALASIPSVKEG